MGSNDVTRRGTLMGAMALTAALGLQVGGIGIAGASTPTWNSPILVAPALSLASGASTNSISCTGPGDCTAAGTYGLPPSGGNPTPSHAFGVTETSGLW